MHTICCIHNNFIETHVCPAFHPVGNGVVCDVSILFTEWWWLPGDGNGDGKDVKIDGNLDTELWSSRRNWRWGEGR